MMPLTSSELHQGINPLMLTAAFIVIKQTKQNKIKIRFRRKLVVGLELEPKLVIFI